MKVGSEYGLVSERSFVQLYQFCSGQLKSRSDSLDDDQPRQTEKTRRGTALGVEERKRWKKQSSRDLSPHLPGTIQTRAWVQDTHVRWLIDTNFPFWKLMHGWQRSIHPPAGGRIWMDILVHLFPRVRSPFLRINRRAVIPRTLQCSQLLTALGHTD